MHKHVCTEEKFRVFLAGQYKYEIVLFDYERFQCYQASRDVTWLTQYVMRCSEVFPEHIQYREIESPLDASLYRGRGGVELSSMS